MSTYADPLDDDGAIPMSAYEGQVWDALNAHWERRDNRRGLPNWANAALGRTGAAAGNAVGRVRNAVPEAVKEPIRRAGGVVDGGLPALVAAKIKPSRDTADALTTGPDNCPEGGPESDATS